MRNGALDGCVPLNAALSQSRFHWGNGTVTQAGEENSLSPHCRILCHGFEFWGELHWKKREKMQWSSFCIGGCFCWAEGRLNYKRKHKECIVFHFKSVTQTFPKSKCCQYYLVGNECGERQFYIHFFKINLSFVYLSNAFLIAWSATFSCEHHPELHGMMLLFQSRPGEADPNTDRGFVWQFWSYLCALHMELSAFLSKSPPYLSQQPSLLKARFQTSLFANPWGPVGQVCLAHMPASCIYTYRVYLYAFCTGLLRAMALHCHKADRNTKGFRQLVLKAHQ